MESKNTIKLNPMRIKEIPISNYDKDFTFYVNGEKYQTCRIIADLLSPKICQFHFNDPTINEYTITTTNPGNFQHVIDLINYEDHIITDDEISFITEILTILNNQSIQVQIEEPKINIANSLSILRKYEKNEIFYASQIVKCIDFISSNFNQIINQSQEEFTNLTINLIEKIIKNDKLRLDSEDQLLIIINDLYQQDPSNSFLYKYVSFTNVSNSMISEFFNIFNYNDLDHEIWSNISSRICQDDTLNFKKDKEIKGIFKYLIQKGLLQSEIKLTTTNINQTNCKSADNLFKFDNDELYFQTENVQNAFIRFEFTSMEFVPTRYKIKTTSHNFYKLKNWTVEVSNDGLNWDAIDTQSNYTLLKNNNNWWPFEISASMLKKCRFIQIRQTGPNTSNQYNLTLGSIDFDGYLVE